MGSTNISFSPVWSLTFGVLRSVPDKRTRTISFPDFPGVRPGPLLPPGRMAAVSCPLPPGPFLPCFKHHTSKPFTYPSPRCRAPQFLQPEGQQGMSQAWSSMACHRPRPAPRRGPELCLAKHSMSSTSRLITCGVGKDPDASLPSCTPTDRPASHSSRVQES